MYTLIQAKARILARLRRVEMGNPGKHFEGNSMTTVVLKKWDVVEHIQIEEDMQLYLDACMEEGDPALIAAALGDIARARGWHKWREIRV